MRIIHQLIIYKQTGKCFENVNKIIISFQLSNINGIKYQYKKNKKNQLY